MKSARIVIFANQYKNAPAQPDGKGLIDLPATLIMELAQLVQQGQFSGTNQKTAEPYIQVACSCWRGDGTVGPNGGITVMSGQIESPSERAAYLASKAQGAQQAPPQQQWGQPPAQAAWGGPPQGVAPAPTQPWGQPMPGQPPAPQQWGPPSAPMGTPIHNPAVPLQQQPAQPMPTDQPMI